MAYSHIEYRESNVPILIYLLVALATIGYAIYEIKTIDYKTSHNGTGYALTMAADRELSTHHYSEDFYSRD